MGTGMRCVGGGGSDCANLGRLLSFEEVWKKLEGVDGCDLPLVSYWPDRYNTSIYDGYVGLGSQWCALCFLRPVREM
jgi:hypothetical protein